MTHNILFNEKVYLLIGPEDGSMHGAIATREQYEECLPSFAHLTPNGMIMRYGQQIGTLKDLTFNAIEPEVT